MSTAVRDSSQQRLLSFRPIDVDNHPYPVTHLVLVLEVRVAGVVLELLSCKYKMRLVKVLFAYHNDRCGQNVDMGLRVMMRRGI